MSTRDLLFEIGVEELPSSFVAGALAALPQLARKKLTELRLTCGEVRALGTPRRLALLVDHIAEQQPDLNEELTGPPVGAAFDKQGAPTRAAEAFAKKLGCEIDALRRVQTPKGEYLAGTRREAGKGASELLGPVLASLVSEIPFRKSMRWGAREETFGRPIQWLVALFGHELLHVHFAGVQTSRTSRGHRFLHLAPVELSHPSGYVDALRDAHVLVDPEARSVEMKRRLAEAASQAGGALIEDAFLVGENVSLVEEPHVVVGEFDPDFLKLPEEVILEVARGHQRYFGMRGRDGKLLPSYLAVVNTATHVANVRRGNDRVMRARLSDARFFYNEDLKSRLEARREKLAGIVFQNRLGHMLAKSRRIERLAAELGAALSLDSSTIAAATRGAHLAKCDLVSLMVGEFGDLQGVMGREYALVQGEPAVVADVIRDHYAPKGASDGTPRAPASVLVALADRMDTLVGCFAVGLTPTGAADPFALRRAALGLLRTLLDNGLDLALPSAICKAYEGFDGTVLDLTLEPLTAKLLDFFRDRLRGLLELELPGDVVDASLATGSEAPLDVRARARALASLSPESRALAGEVFKRASNIAKSLPQDKTDGIAPDDASAFAGGDVEPAELVLFQEFERLRLELRATSLKRDYAGAVASICALAPHMSAFFEQVFVMVDDLRVRNRRLSLMRSISAQCSRIAHFQLLSSEGPR